MMSDWDLQAVIRGWSCAGANPTAGTSHVREIDYEPLDRGFVGPGQEREFFGDFPDVFETGAAADFFDELDGMCRPLFYDEVARGQARVTVGHGSSSASQQPAVTVKEEEEQPVNDGSSPVVSAVTSSGTAAQAAKYKRSRKNQQKRVVQQARAEGLSSSDKWAWRKYGQKPIKGSPYPRSYYRCSSSKGCPARKQVEQSRTDPAMHLITYTGDHNHSHPTRRNSLSGVARNKFPNPTRHPRQATLHETSVGPTFVKVEGEEEVPGIVFSDDLFPTLEDLHGCILD